MAGPLCVYPKVGRVSRSEPADYRRSDVVPPPPELDDEAA
jgi:hypothetical protein